ncbi:MAG: CsbD family protein [Anaerolineaceae bacterium]
MALKNDSVENKLKGKANQAAGAAREKVGKAVGNEELEGEGRAQNIQGDFQETMGDVQGKVADAAKKAKGALKP